MPKKPKCPCSKGCENRTATCHGQCEPYTDYEQKMRIFYQEKLEIGRGLRCRDNMLKAMDKNARYGRKGTYPTWEGE